MENQILLSCPPCTISASISPICPQCKSKRVWKDAKRQNSFGYEIQRWYCRDCARRFSDPTDLERAKKAFENLKVVETVDTKSLKSKDPIVSTSQICVKETKNLDAEPQTNEVLRRNENEAGDFKQKILEYALWLKHNGKSEATIFGRVKLLRRLTKTRRKPLRHRISEENHR